MFEDDIELNKNISNEEESTEEEIEQEITNIVEDNIYSEKYSVENQPIKRQYRK